jgi:anti-anti-sigma factor
VPLLNVALVPGPDQVVVRLTGDADLSTVPQLSDALVQAAGLGTSQLVVDLAAARFWDSSALHALTTFTAELAAAGRACRIVGAGPTTRRLIRAAGLADRLDLDGPVPGPTTPRPAPERRASRPRGAAAPAARRAGVTPLAEGLAPHHLR